MGFEKFEIFDQYLAIRWKCNRYAHSYYISIERCHFSCAKFFQGQCPKKYSKYDLMKLIYFISW